MSSLGSKIKHLREQNNINQKELAKKLAISNVQLSRYESDERRPDYETLTKIADYFNITVDYLLGRQDLSIEDKEDFEKFSKDPSLQRMFKEMKDSPEEDLEELQQIWNIIKNRKK